MFKIIYFFIIGLFLIGNIYAESSEVTVIYVSGSVDICSGDESYPCSKAIEDMTVTAGDKIITAQDSSIELAFDENKKNILRVNPESEVVISLKDNEKVELTKGEVFTTIEELPSGSSFEIRTPTAIAGVRGTEWLTKVDEEGTDIEAFQGTPYAKTIYENGKVAPQETIVLSGHMTRVKRFKPPSALMPLPGRNQKRLRIMQSQVRNHRAQAILRKPPKAMSPKPGMGAQGNKKPQLRKPPIPQRRQPQL
ncbi:MAG: FecR family protein [Candidatus Omnitrophica bacterium]|nr:FecR family protein [Candidatus Omnitrophota bacterium]